MGTVVIVEAIPFSDLLSEIDIALVGEQLAELLLVGPVRSFRLTVELRCSRFDVNMRIPLSATCQWNIAWNSYPRSVRIV